MNGSTERIAPEFLHDYVDGQLDDATRLEVARHLAQCPGDRERVACYEAQNEALHQLYDGVLAEPIPDRLLQVLGPAPPQEPPSPAPSAPMRRSMWPRATAAAAAMVVVTLGSAAIGWKVRGDIDAEQYREMAVASFLKQASNSFSLYADQDTPWSSGNVSEVSKIADWFKDKLEFEFDAPSLENVGLEFVGGRALPSAEGAAGQLVYRDSEDRMVAVYFQTRGSDTAIAPADGGGEEAAAPGRFVQGDDASIYHWKTGDTTYALVGSLDRDALTSLAETVRGNGQRTEEL